MQKNENMLHTQKKKKQKTTNGKYPHRSQILNPVDKDLN